jgi:hypothetical protein
MSTLSFSTLAIGLGLAAVTTAQETGPESVKGASVTINGCVVAGKDGSFVLTNVEEISGPRSTVAAAVPAGMTGAQGASEGAIYWLSQDSVKVIRAHAGHKVQVTGVITDLSTGSVRIKQEPGKPGSDNDNKIEVSARGKEASAETDKAVGTRPATAEVSDRTQAKPVRRVKVGTVKMLSATCS